MPVVHLEVHQELEAKSLSLNHRRLPHRHSYHVLADGGKQREHFSIRLQESTLFSRLD